MHQTTSSRIQNFIYNHIVVISSYISLTTLAYIGYSFSNRIENTINSVLSYMNLGYINLSFFRSRQFMYRSPIDENSYSLIDLLTPSFYILMSIGVILYLVSKRSEKRILQFCFSIIFIGKIVGLLAFTIRLCTIENPFQEPLWVLLYLCKTLLILYISYIFLSRSISEAVIVNDDEQKIYFGGGDLFLLKFKKASKMQRLLHYIVDIFVMMLIFSKYIFIIPRDYIYALENTLGEQLTRFVLFFIVSTIYYLIFEGIFKTTPGKCLTQTKLIFFVKKKVNFSQVVSRTLSRRIPFEAFSFFGKFGWHDSISRTTVVQLENQNKYKKVAIGILIFIGMLTIYRFMQPFFRYF